MQSSRQDYINFLRLASASDQRDRKFGLKSNFTLQGEFFPEYLGEHPREYRQIGRFKKQTEAFLLRQGYSR